MKIKYFKDIILPISVVVLLLSYSAWARRVRLDSIPQQLLHNGETIIQTSDDVVFTLKLEEYPQDDRFLGQRYVISVFNQDGVEIAYSCFRIHNEWAYGYEDFRSNDAFYYYNSPENSDTDYVGWLSMSDGRNPGPALMVREDYRTNYKGIGTTLTSIGLQLVRILGIEYFDAINVLNPGFHQTMGYQLIPRQGIGGSVNMTFDLTDPSGVLPPIEIVRRP